MEEKQMKILIKITKGERGGKLLKDLKRPIVHLLLCANCKYFSIVYSWKPCAFCYKHYLC